MGRGGGGKVVEWSCGNVGRLLYVSVGVGEDWRWSVWGRGEVMFWGVRWGFEWISVPQMYCAMARSELGFGACVMLYLWVCGLDGCVGCTRVLLFSKLVVSRVLCLLFFFVFLMNRRPPISIL